MFFDRYEIHIQAFLLFIKEKWIISVPHLHKNYFSTIYSICFSKQIPPPQKKKNVSVHLSVSVKKNSVSRMHDFQLISPNWADSVIELSCLSVEMCVVPRLWVHFFSRPSWWKRKIHQVWKTWMSWWSFPWMWIIHRG